MIITNEFVLLNYPKTGSSFARRIIKQVYRSESGMVRVSELLGLKKKKILELKHKNLFDSKRTNNQHGGYYQIPKEHRAKPIVSIMRDPFEKFLSGYEYKFYGRKPQVSQAEIETHFPTFPDISIDEYVKMNEIISKRRAKELGLPIQLGPMTLQFIRMFFKEPSSILEKMNEDYFSNKNYLSDIADVHFLKQEQLNREIYEFLKGLGFEESKLSFIKNHKRVNSTKKLIDNRKNLWTESAIKYMTSTEGHLIKMLNDLGYDYQAPTELSPPA